MRTFLANIEARFAGALMAGIILVLFAQVISRYVLAEPLSWTEEVARHLLVWLVFIGASAAIRERTHVLVDVVVNLLPPGARRAVAVVNDLLILFFLANVFWFGARAVERMWSVSTATLELPTGLVYLVFPISAAMMILRTLVRITEDWRTTPALPDAETTIAHALRTGG